MTLSLRNETDCTQPAPLSGKIRVSFFVFVRVAGGWLGSAMLFADQALRPAAASLLLSVSMLTPGSDSSQVRNQKTYLRSSSAVLWDVDGTLVDRSASP